MEFLLLIMSILAGLSLLWALDRIWHHKVEIFAYLLGARKILAANQYSFIQKWQNTNFANGCSSLCYSLSSKPDVTVLIKLHQKQFLLVSENVLDKKAVPGVDLSALKPVNIDFKFIFVLISLFPLELIQRSIASSVEMPFWLKRGLLGIAICIFAPFLIFISLFISKKSRLYSVIHSPVWWLERWSVSFEIENSILAPYFESVILC